MLPWGYGTQLGLEECALAIRNQNTPMCLWRPESSPQLGLSSRSGCQMITQGRSHPGSVLPQVAHG